MIKNRAFTILELLVVLAVIGVFSAIAYPNVSSWIADRNVKNAAFETVAFVKDRKSEVTSGKYGMTQILFNRQLQVFTMSPNNLLKFIKVPILLFHHTNKIILVDLEIQQVLQDKTSMTKKILVLTFKKVMSIYIRVRGIIRRGLQFVLQRMDLSLITVLIKMEESKINQQVKWLISFYFVQNLIRLKEAVNTTQI